MPSLAQYYIKASVRRCVATREAGLTEISATIFADGQPDQLVRLRLDQLHSPKTYVDRDPRYIRYAEYPIAVLGQEPPPIEVEVLGAAGQTGSIPLVSVVFR